ncbi:MAG: helix-turn-helix transcriptional regulator [Clostridia bacterium]|nr:helix-turn-helix transcriptional regulator [Clostridia bacterium]
MGMAFKINVLQALKDKGYSTYRIKNDKLLSQSTLQKLREGKPVSWENIETFCRLLEMQPGELLEYNPDTEDDK